MEDLLFREGKGDFLSLYKLLGFSSSPLPVSGRSSLQTWLPRITRGQTILLVHNTFITEEDIVFAKEHATQYGLTLLYCICPGANRYVENALPPLDLLIKHGCSIVIGTDSLGSNGQLDIAAEIAIIREAFPAIPLHQVLQWATGNGAAALKWKHLGGFHKGAKPGVVLMGEDHAVQRLV
jgi:cytosine/adenosine deaminase-related metal-dependent hydrolase